MEQFGVATLMLGLLICVIAHYAFVITAFRMSSGAGFAALFFGCLFYVAMIVMNPRLSWKPLAIAAVGLVLVLIGGRLPPLTWSPNPGISRDWLHADTNELPHDPLMQITRMPLFPPYNKC